MSQKIPGNMIKNSGECSTRFRGMLLKILGECSSGFREMFKKIPGNLNFDLFLEILLASHQFLLLNCCKTLEKAITEQFF